MTTGRLKMYSFKTATGDRTRLVPRAVAPVKNRRGLSLVELLVSVTVMGILTAMAVPSFRRAVEQSRADIAAANLRAVWSAERCYWLDNRTYTDDLTQLRDLGLLDPSIVTGTSSYVYTIEAVDSTTFTAMATRVAGTKWNGEFIVDQTGVVTGSINATGEPSIVPGFQ